MESIALIGDKDLSCKDLEKYKNMLNEKRLKNVPFIFVHIPENDTKFITGSYVSFKAKVVDILDIYFDKIIPGFENILEEIKKTIPNQGIMLDEVNDVKVLETNTISLDQCF